MVPESPRKGPKLLVASLFVVGTLSIGLILGAGVEFLIVDLSSHWASHVLVWALILFLFWRIWSAIRNARQFDTEGATQKLFAEFSKAESKARKALKKEEPSTPVEAEGSSPTDQTEPSSRPPEPPA